MSELNLDHVKQIFLEVRGAEETERERLIEVLCGEDEVLRARIRDLLMAEGEIGDFLDAPTMAEANVAALAAAPAESEPPVKLGSRVGPYKLLQVIGEGGFGVVYMADQEEPIRRRVALKVIKPGMDTKQVIARFEAERQALAMMDHPNIAKVFEAGTTSAGRPYFVMELVRGIPITDYCDQHRLDTRQRLELFADVCGAVHHAHKCGIIHRDIKPSNVMVTLHDGTPVPKVIDFGIAKATRNRLTESTLFTEYNQFIGSPTYMSPEQAAYEGLDVDDRADVYSLGVLLYELLTGTTPHSSAMKKAAYVEVVRILKEEEPPKPSTRIQTLGPSSETYAEHRHADPVGLARLLRGDLDWIVMKALEKERSRRYGSAEEMASDISRYFNQMPIVARPPSAVYRARKLFRRRRGPIATAAVMVLALMLEVSYVGWQRSQAASASALALASAAAISTTTAAREVWTWPEGNFSGSISPDGRYLSLSQAGPNLRVHDFATGEDRDITRDSNADIAIWSPDGKQLAYTSYCDQSRACAPPQRWGSVYELRITGLEGLDSRLLYRGDGDDGVQYPGPEDWSPDGQHILVWAGGVGEALILVSVGDGSTRLLKSFDRDPNSGGGAVFSPDGEYVAYGYPPDETSRTPDIFLIAVDGSHEVQLTETPASESVLGWEPDGTLLFSSDRNGSDAIFKIGVENGTPTGPAVMVRSDLGDLGRVLGTTRDGALYYKVQPDNSPVAYTAAFDPETVEVIGSPKRVTPTFPAFAADPEWSPDGERLAYWSRNGADQLLVIRDLRSGRETVSGLDMGGNFQVEWHPEGESVVVNGWLQSRGDLGVFQVDVTEGAIPRPIPYEERGWVGLGGTAYRLELDCGRDEAQLSRTLNGPRQCGWRWTSFVGAAIMKKDRETGLRSELYRLAGPLHLEPRWALSPDGRDVVVQVGTADAPVLEIVSTTSGVARHLTDLTYGGEPVQAAGLTWTPNGHEIVFFGSRVRDEARTRDERQVNPSPVRLYRVPASGGDIEPVGLETSWADRGLGTLSGPREAVFRPDGREIRFLASQPLVGEGAQERGWTVWVLDNFLHTSGEGS